MRKNETTGSEMALAPSDIRPLIHEIRGVQVILDRDLAFLYGVTTGNLNKAVKRNLERFPADFMFQLTKDESLIFQIGILNGGCNPSETEAGILRFQTGTLKLGQGKHFKYQPYAFTENGIAMLSSVLHSERAIEVNIRIMREFVALRKTLASFGPMLARIETVERRQITDAYVGMATLDMLAKRTRGVKIELVTHSNGELVESDFEAFAKQCGHFTKTLCGICHDRFIVVDQKEIFWTGASFKDAGRLTFAAAKMGAEMIPGLLASVHNAASERKEYGKAAK